MEKIINNKYPNIVAENATIDPKYKDLAIQLTSSTIFEFLELCKVPRPSQHMGPIRKYLMEWAQEHKDFGITAKLDKSGCVIMDVAPSEGCDENGISYNDYPNVILQAHMDMVCTATKEYRHNNYAGTRWSPKHDSIPAIYDRTTGIISTEGKCSLGADDGHGIAAALAIATNLQYKHGPLRLLFSYDEEVNMQGVRNLNPEELNADYLINLDSIYVGTVLASAAGGFEAVIAKQYQTTSAPDETSLFTLRMGGLRGGHSGEDIAKGRGSTTEVCFRIMKSLYKNNIEFGIAKLKVGSAMNAIATTMKMILVIHEKDTKIVSEIVEKESKRAQDVFVDSNNLDYDITVEPSYAAQTISRKDTLKILQILKNIPHGPLKMIEKTTPESSCNAGVIDIREGLLKINVLYRTCKDQNLDSVYEHFQNIADEAKADLMIKAIFPSWTKIDTNPLNDLFLESYQKACGFEGISIDIHSGLECGYLANKKANLIMASIGCDLCAEHTPSETLYTKSMPAFMSSLLYVLDHIKDI